MDLPQSASRIGDLMADKIDCEYTQEIVCPHCGYAHSESYEFGDGGEEDGQDECGRCGKEFYWSRTISVSYSTWKPRRLCDDCLAGIPNERLEILPDTRYCVKCAENHPLPAPDPNTLCAKSAGSARNGFGKSD